MESIGHRVKRRPIRTDFEQIHRAGAMQAVMFLLCPIPQAPVDNFFGIFWYAAGFRILAQDVVVKFV